MGVNMKSSKQWLLYLVIGAAAVAAGIFIFFQTEEFAKMLVFGIGLFVFLNGASALIAAVRKGFDEWTRNSQLIRGFLGVVVGIVAVLLPLAVARNIWYLMVYILAGELAVSGLLALFSLGGLKNQGISLARPVINAVISLALALVIFIMPKESGQVLLSLIAAAVVIYGITMIMIGINKKKTLKADSPAGKAGAGKAGTGKAKPGKAKNDKKGSGNVEAGSGDANQSASQPQTGTPETDNGEDLKKT
jgi:uncharacterized membrane protein HdeD (DUF308 family)